MKLYFARHGESEANVLRVISNRGMQHGLTETGRQQAQALTAQLRSAAISAIYTSPLLRALQTGEILSAALGIPFVATDALREYDCGILEGTSGPATWDAYWQQRADWIAGGKWAGRIEGGESFLDMQARFVPFIRQLLTDEKPVASNIVLVGHGGLYQCMLPLVLANVSHELAGRLPFPNTGYVLAESRPEGLVCLEWCGDVMA
jgi:probable phosphoglycerate mutase